MNLNQGPATKRRALIDKLKQIALDNYEQGGDGFVECYDDQDWIQFIEGANGKPVSRLRKDMKLYKSVVDDIRNS